MNFYIDGSENLLRHLKGKNKNNTSDLKDKNNTSEKGDFELTNTKEAVHAVEVP